MILSVFCGIISWKFKKYKEADRGELRGEAEGEEQTGRAETGELRGKKEGNGTEEGGERDREDTGSINKLLPCSTSYLKYCHVIYLK